MVQPIGQTVLNGTTLKCRCLFLCIFSTEKTKKSETLRPCDGRFRPNSPPPCDTICLRLRCAKRRQALPKRGKARENPTHFDPLGQNLLPVFMKKAAFSTISLFNPTKLPIFGNYFPKPIDFLPIFGKIKEQQEIREPTREKRRRYEEE